MSEMFDKSQMSETIDVPAGWWRPLVVPNFYFFLFWRSRIPLDINASGGSRISQRRCANLKGGCQPIIWPNFPQNCMNTKRNGPGDQLKIICVNYCLNLLLFLDKNSARNFIRCVLTHCTVGCLAVPLGAPAAHLPALPGGVTRHLRRDARHLHRGAPHRLQGRTTEYWKKRRKQRLSTTKYLWIDSYQNLKGLLDFVVHA